MRYQFGICVYLVCALYAYPQHRGGFASGLPGVRPVPPIGTLPPGTHCGVRMPGAVQPAARGWWRNGTAAGFRYNSFVGGGPFYPLPYPGYAMSEYNPDPTYSYDQQPPNMGPVPLQQSAPPVIINQYGSVPGQVPVPEPMVDTPTVQTHQAPVSSEPDETDRPMWFIALKDGWVYTASEYWVENGTLHYLTKGGKHNQVSLELVDRQTAAKLNKDRDFRLPPH
jgi:hypothetical protein